MGIFFAILSPALYGINNFIDKFFLEKYRLHPVIITIFSGIFACFTGVIILLFAGFYTNDIRSIFIIVCSGFLNALYVLPYFKALSEDETSRVIPLFQFVPVFVLVLSFFFLQERFYVMQYIGCVIVIVGSFLLSLKTFSIKIFAIRPALWFMLLSSFISSLSIILFKLGVKMVPFWQTLPYEGFGMRLGSLAILSYKQNFQLWKKETKRFRTNIYLLMSVNESMYILARYTGYFAISLISVSIATILGGFQPFFVLLYGIILSIYFPKIMKESMAQKVLFQKSVSIAVIFLGIWLIFK